VKEDVAMADRSDVRRRPPRAPLQSRSRRRWALAAGLIGLWAFLLADTGSLVAGTALRLLGIHLSGGARRSAREALLRADHAARQAATAPTASAPAAR